MSAISSFRPLSRLRLPPCALFLARTYSITGGFRRRSRDCADPCSVSPPRSSSATCAITTSNDEIIIRFADMSARPSASFDATSSSVYPRERLDAARALEPKLGVFSRRRADVLVLDLQPLEVDRAEILAGFLLGAQDASSFRTRRVVAFLSSYFRRRRLSLGGGAKVPRGAVHGAHARVDGAGGIAFEFERLALVGDARVRLDARAEVVEFNSPSARARELVLDRLELGVDHGVALEDGEGAGSRRGGAGARFLLGAARGSLRGGRRRPRGPRGRSAVGGETREVRLEEGVLVGDALALGREVVAARAAIGEREADSAA